MTLGFILTMKIFVLSVNGASVKKIYKTKHLLFWIHSTCFGFWTSTSQLFFVDCKWITGVLGCQGGAWGRHSPHTSHIWLKEADCYPSVLYRVYALQMSRWKKKTEKCLPRSVVAFCQYFFFVPSGMMLSRQLPDCQQEYQKNGGER